MKLEVEGESMGCFWPAREHRSGGSIFRCGMCLTFVGGFRCVFGCYGRQWLARRWIMAEMFDRNGVSFSFFFPYWMDICLSFHVFNATRFLLRTFSHQNVPFLFDGTLVQLLPWFLTCVHVSRALLDFAFCSSLKTMSRANRSWWIWILNLFY